MEPERSDFGARMKRLREERGVALRDIADATKISVSALEALERNDISRLPGGIFSRGFVRAYAEQVGADPDTVVREFMARFPNDSIAEGGSHAAAYDGPGSGAMKWMAIAVAVLIPVIALLLWTLL